MINKQLSNGMICAIFIFALIFICSVTILGYMAIILFPKYCLVAFVTFLATIGAVRVINKLKDCHD